MLTEDGARAALATIPYPGLERDIVALGLVRSVTVRNGRVHVSLALSTSREDVPELVRRSICQRLAEVGAIRSEVQILPLQRPATGASNPWADRTRMVNVGKVVAVGAGKGGVGKSTVAVNVALALRADGYRVGLLDADIHGPSVPVLVGLEDGASRVQMSGRKQIIPLDTLGLSVVSFGFFLGPQSPAVWRGPMVGKAVKQFSRGVLWPSLDVLVVDLPPGTGDVPLSLAQSVIVDGAVVITTPQRLSVLEARKAVEMFRKLEVPLLGLVENMAGAECSCGRTFHPFGRGGGAGLADELGVPLLGEIPFDEDEAGGGDAGLPAVHREPGGPTGAAFQEVARRVARGLGLAVPPGAAPGELRP